MKCFFKESKRGIITIIFALCILLSITGTYVYAATAKQGETNDVVNIEEELVPMMAQGCGYGDLTSWDDIDHATKKAILRDVNGNYKAVVGNNPDIYYGSDGLIYLCGVASAYMGATYPTDLERSWYL